MSASAFLRALVAAVLFAPALAGPALAAGAQTERELARVFEALDANKFELAMQRVEALIAANPNFRLAHLIRGDLLMARTRPLATFGNAKHLPRERVEELRAEALARISAWRDRPVNRVPRYVLQLQPQQKQALVVDSRRSRLYVFENLDGRARYVTDYYVTLGKNGIEKAREGDQKTPVGVYHVTSSLPRQKLTDFYGSGAWPINYPNEWDRRQGRNGHGIWLHGTPSNTYSRPPRASDGCIVLTNADLDLLGQDLQIGLTPVIIADQIEWVDAGAQEAERKALAARARGLARRLGKPGYRALPEALRREVRVRRPVARRVVRAQAQGQCGQVVDQGRPVAGEHVPLPGRRRLRRGHLPAGLPLEQPVERDEEAPVLDQGRRALEDPSRRRGLSPPASDFFPYRGRPMNLSRLFKPLVMLSAIAAATGAAAADPQVDIKTSHGTIRLELNAGKAPKTVANFLQYVRDGHFNGTIFHRVIDGFMIQGGGFDKAYQQKKTRDPIENEAEMAMV